MPMSAFTDDDPPAPRPRTYNDSSCPAARVATRLGQMRPGTAIAPQKLAAAIADGVSALEWSGPASRSRTLAAGSSDKRAANTAPAEPAPTTMWSYRSVNGSRPSGSRAGHR